MTGPPLISGWMTGPPLFQVEWPGPPPPLIWRSGFTIGQGPLLSCSSFAKGMKKSMNLRRFCKTKPLSASFPLKNFNPFYELYIFYKFFCLLVWASEEEESWRMSIGTAKEYICYNWSRFHSLESVEQNARHANGHTRDWRRETRGARKQRDSLFSSRAAAVVSRVSWLRRFRARALLSQNLKKRRDCSQCIILRKRII